MAAMHDFDADELDGATMALVLVSHDRGQEDWGMFKGKVRREGASLFLDSLEGEEILEIVDEWHRYIQPVDASVRDVLQDATWVLPLPARAVPAELLPEDF